MSLGFLGFFKWKNIHFINGWTEMTDNLIITSEWIGQGLTAESWRPAWGPGGTQVAGREFIAAARRSATPPSLYSLLHLHRHSVPNTSFSNTEGSKQYFLKSPCCWVSLAFSFSQPSKGWSCVGQRHPAEGPRAQVSYKAQQSLSIPAPPQTHTLKSASSVTNI